jgi:WD40 repeat protein
VTHRVLHRPPGGEPTARLDFFVSFASDDADWVHGFLLPGLREAGVRVGSEADFQLGTPLAEQFTSAVERSDRVLLVVSPAYLADDSALRVRLLAQQYGLEHSTWPVLPVLLHPVPRLPLSLSMLTALDATDEADWDDCLRRLLAELDREAPRAETTPACPYPGMAPYGLDLSGSFHGRSAEIEEALQRLRLHPVLAVVGPSGSGKSSLLHAGVEPRLLAADKQVVTIRPGARPHDALTTALWEGRHPDRPLVLVVDQLEELFTVAATAPEPQVTEFCAEVLRLRASGTVELLFALRADYYPQLMVSPLWDLVRDHRLEILPLTGEQLREAIAAPAEEVGVHLESALVHRIVQDAAGQPGSLPLVQETLVLLWGRLRRRYLPISAYDALVLPTAAYGEPPRTGLQVALARRADATMAELPTEEERLVARRIFLRLVQLMDGRDDVRRQQRRAELQSEGDDPPTFDRVLQHLIDARLLTCRTDERTNDSSGALIDLAHEAIITGWPALRSWIADRRAAERVRRQFEASAQTWVGLGRGAGGLLDEVELAQVEGWIDGPDSSELGMSRDLSDLVAASRSSLRTARARKVRMDRLLRGLAVALAVLLVCVLLVAVAAVRQRNEAEDSRDLARANQLAVSASALPPEQVDRALLLAQQAIGLRPTPLTIGAVINALSSNPRVQRVLHSRIPQDALALTPDGAFAVTGGMDGVVRVWDVGRGGRSKPLAQLDGEIRGVAVRPDGAAVVATSSEGEIRQWALPGGAPLAQQRGAPAHEGSVRAVAYSGDGRYLATAGQDGRVVLHDARTGQVIRVFSGYADWLNAVAFTPDGSLLLAGGGRTSDTARDHRIVGWDVATGTQRLELPGHDAAVRSLTVDRDSRLLASTGGDGLVRLWSLATGALVHELTGHRGRVFSVAFTPDGSRLASGGSDHTVRIWDPATGQAVGDPLRGSGDYVRAVAYTGPDRLVAVGGGTRLFVWDVRDRPQDRLAEPLADQPVNSRAVAVDPEGTLMATGDDQGGVVLRRAADGAPTGIVLNAGEPVSSVAFGPNGMLVTATYAGHVRVWNARSGAALTAAVDLQERSVVVAVSPDGAYIATGGELEMIRIWDPSLQLLTSLDGHRHWVRALAFRESDGALVSAGADGRAFLWSGVPDARRRTLTERTNGMETLAISPDGETIAIGNLNGEVVLWDAQPESLARANQTALTGHDGVPSVAYDPATGWIITADRAGVLRVWDADSRLEPLGVLGHVSPVWGLAIVSANSELISVGEGGVTRWTLDRGDWHRISCAVAGRNPVAAEIERYGLQELPRPCRDQPHG